MTIELKRTVLNIAGCCNLKCKHCLAFIPYYKQKWLMNKEEAKRVIDAYFSLVDYVGTFTITGGEPLLNHHLGEILNYVNNYSERIGQIDMVTNGTLLINDEILNFFQENKEHTRIILSDYGSLSTMIEENVEKLKEKKITFRISSFSGDDLYYGGWIDFSDHSLKWKTIEERKKNASKCIHAVGKYYVINDECLHRCSRSFWRMKNGIIPYVKGEFVPLTDNSIPLERKKELLQFMMSQSNSTSCAYCVGLRNDVSRVKPAIQLGEDKD